MDKIRDISNMLKWNQQNGPYDYDGTLSFDKKSPINSGKKFAFSFFILSWTYKRMKELNSG